VKGSEKPEGLEARRLECWKAGGFLQQLTVDPRRHTPFESPLTGCPITGENPIIPTPFDGGEPG